MTLIDHEEIIRDDCNTAKVLNTFFSNIVSNLNIAEYSNCEPLANNISNPVLKYVVKYRSHPSILAIGEVCNKHPRLPFSFSKINREEMLGEILKLETFELPRYSYSDKNYQENADIFADILFASCNDSVEKSNFPSSLKEANITPVFKKGDIISKYNYRPVSILPNMLKIFERCIFRQLYSFMLEFLSKYQCGFRKGYSTQHCLLVILEK